MTEKVFDVVERPLRTATLRRIVELWFPKALTGGDGDVGGDRGASA